MNKPLIIIAGPTACGKTAVSIEVAKKLNGSIISADSMQVYKYMDIGTAKIGKDEMGGITHYLIDELYPDEEFSVAVFQKMAKSAYKDIISNYKVPIMVGGTGFYINAFLYDNDFSQENNKNIYRKEYESLLEEKGKEYIFELLKEKDIEYAETIHMNNTKKVIRALEYIAENNEKFSEYNKREALREPAYDHKLFILNMERERLYKRIDLRVGLMIENGLIKEVENLLNMGYNSDLVSMQGLGYKEIVMYLQGKCSLDEAIYILKRDTRHFAKRQITWFKHQCKGIWLNMDEYSAPEDAANEICKEYTNV